ncbi:MAG: hypothetical protein RIC89_17855 [Pseudomonadales bacterium]
MIRNTIFVLLASIAGIGISVIDRYPAQTESEEVGTTEHTISKPAVPPGKQILAEPPTQVSFTFDNVESAPGRDEYLLPVTEGEMGGIADMSTLPDANLGEDFDPESSYPESSSGLVGSLGEELDPEDSGHTYTQNRSERVSLGDFISLVDGVE